MERIVLWPVVAMAIALAVAGCGSDGRSGSGTTAGPRPTYSPAGTWGVALQGQSDGVPWQVFSAATEPDGGRCVAVFLNESPTLPPDVASSAACDAVPNRGETTREHLVLQLVGTPFVPGAGRGVAAGVAQPGASEIRLQLEGGDWIEARVKDGVWAAPLDFRTEISAVEVIQDGTVLRRCRLAVGTPVQIAC